jgi:peptidoglycan/xylan/chitin deacetylase (PgdA/CDA1 family)
MTFQVQAAMRSRRVVPVLLALLVALGGGFGAGPAAGATADAKRSCTADAAAPAKEFPAWLASPGAALVTVGAVNLRAGPGVDCPVIGTLGFGVQVQIEDVLLEQGQFLWRKVTTPLGEGYTIATAYQGMPAVAPSAVPVLMYHHIDESGSRYAVSPATLAAQLAWLRDNGYVSITPQDLYNARYNGLALPARPVMLTIDDGAASSETFRRLLDQHGFRGVYFLPNATALTAEQIVQMANSGEVCGHTVSHPFLDRLDYAGQHAEIVGNKTWLEGIIGRPVSCFAYPYGAYNDITAQVMAASGYQTAFNAWGGMAPVSSDADPYHIQRIEVYGEYDLTAFTGIVSGYV